jgi:SAM-dependent methyltransferase
MSQSTGDQAFVDAIPEVYERLVVPLIFESYAADLARRVAATAPRSVLEIAAGTGVLTRQLAMALPDSTSIVATDLNGPMLEQAKARGTRRSVQWEIADALKLPFADGSFDAIACQFGAMFFPDKTRAYSEVRRVLRPGGRFFFNVWDRIEDNEFTVVTESALGELFPENPPRFFSRTPHGYCNSALIERELAAAGFTDNVEVHTVTARSRAECARIAATALCFGTPLRNEIEARAPPSLESATDHVTTAIAKRFGTGPIDGKIQAIVFSVARIC